jgi:hypothetical protein
VPRERIDLADKQTCVARVGGDDREVAPLQFAVEKIEKLVLFD